LTPEGDSPQAQTKPVDVTAQDEADKAAEARFEAQTEGVGEGTSVLEAPTEDEVKTFVTPQTFMPADAVEPGPTTEGKSGEGNL
jgi:hypothetical protein